VSGPRSCERWREAIGALLDGEEPGIEPALVDAHVAACANCRSFRAAAADLARPRFSVIAAAPADAAPLAVAESRRRDGMWNWSIPRIVLAVCAIEVIAFSIADLLGGTLLVVVARPARAHAMLPVALVLGIALAVGAVVDLVQGRVPLLGEARHIPELVSVWMLWLLSRPDRHPYTRRDGPPDDRTSSETGLRSVT
jgi:predicted anti-sigma-YlaC factor YlaD